MSNAKDLMRLGGLWTNTDRNGKKYLTGRLSADVRILIFKNEFRTEEKHPTHIMYLAPVERQDDAARPQQESDDFLVDELASGGEAAADEPAPPPPLRSAAPSRPAPAPRPATPTQRPAAGRPAAPASRPAPRRAEPSDDFEELEDPFAE